MTRASIQLFRPIFSRAVTDEVVALSLALSPLCRGRQNSGKVRHKRQALQDMARPLKQWLYKHRDNPYPTKTEKILLALSSQMTLVQVFIFSYLRYFMKVPLEEPFNHNVIYNLIVVEMILH